MVNFRKVIGQFLLVTLLLTPSISLAEKSKTELYKTLDTKTYTEKALLKSDLIVSTANIEPFTKWGIDIYPISITKINNGIEVLVQATGINGPIGFGADGTIETERMRIINPPILVKDPLGDIARPVYDSKTKTTKDEYYREDSIEALHQVLGHVVKVIKKDGKNIIPGSVGHTVTTFYPDASTGGTSFDGAGWTSNAVYADSHDRATSQGQSATNASDEVSHKKPAGDGYIIYRAVFTFNTASIGSDIVSAAVFSINPSAKNDDDADSLRLVSTNPASSSNITNSDYATFGTTALASDYDITSLTTSVYNDFTLNSTGRALIGSTTKLGLRTAKDAANTAPASSTNNSVTMKFADTAGTTSDPVLVVTHAAAPPAPTGTGSGLLDGSGTLLLYSSWCDTYEVSGSGASESLECSAWSTTVEISAIRYMTRVLFFSTIQSIVVLSILLVFIYWIVKILQWFWKVLTKAK